ncbi:MAG: hypothetical protein ACXWL2_03695 [Candidatus Chromulinivorax sp.]
MKKYMIFICMLIGFQILLSSNYRKRSELSSQKLTEKTFFTQAAIQCCPSAYNAGKKIVDSDLKWELKAAMAGGIAGGTTCCMMSYFQFAPTVCGCLAGAGCAVVSFQAGKQDGQDLQNDYKVSYKNNFK